MTRSWREMNSLTLAYLGDAVYELWVRTHLLDLGYVKAQDLHRRATTYVRASTQAQILQHLLNQLDETESEVVLRGRNAKGGHPKNVDVITYRHATAFETLVGFWQLEKRFERMKWAFDQIDTVLDAKLEGKQAAEEI